jgi:4-hydroxybenzoate polyprenyltransferase
MYFKNIFCIFLFCQTIISESFISKKILLQNNNIELKNNIIDIKLRDTYYYTNLINNKRIYLKNTTQKIIKKTNSFLKLIRYKNIPSTLLLSFSSGFIINKSLFELFNSKIFMVSTLITLLIMSCSMIINDIFDINIDMINNKNRPLINGEIKMHEALYSVFLLLGLTKYLSIRYLNQYLKIIVNIAILIISLYTPILKKITFVKNLSCALLVSFSTYFAALSSLSEYKIIETKNIYILGISSLLIFLGSLYNELLLDMFDYDGDKINNINTIPVVYGLNFSWNLANFILKFNILINFLNLLLLFDIRTSIILLYIMGPMIIDLKNIKKYNYKTIFIKNCANKLYKPLFLSLIYLCILSIY